MLDNPKELRMGEEFEKKDFEMLRERAAVLDVSLEAYLLYRLIDMTDMVRDELETSRLRETLFQKSEERKPKRSKKNCV